ncbi:glycosyltransferase family 8 protein, partial [Baudoinia panamericana UAMH 10762]
MAYQLLHSKSAGTNNSIPFLVLCTEDVKRSKRVRLKKDGATVIIVEKVESDWAKTGTPRWRDNLAKLRLWQLTEYSKICFIDADNLITKPLDGAFYDEATLTQATGTNPAAIQADEAALPRTYMFAAHGDLWGYDHPYPPDPDLSYLNGGFWVFTPSKVMFEYYMSLLELPGRFDPGFMEQNLLNYAHRRDGNMPWKPLWYGWNVNWPTARDWRGGARSFHAKYWDGDASHDPVLKAIWKEQRAEMEGYYRGRD